VFTDLIVEALNVTHPRFAHARRRESFVLELYHQLRRLWDKALPVKLGLGHVMLHDDPTLPDPPELIFWRLGEGGAADARLGVVSVSYLPTAEDVDRDLTRLAACRAVGYPHAVGVVVAPHPTAVPARDDVSVVVFDVDTNTARVVAATPPR
jgi:hypothetical protein